MDIKAGVVGAAGFAGIEIVRLVLGHPAFSLVAATSNELAGQPICDAYPEFTDVTDLTFSSHDDAPLERCDVVFLAVPHTASLGQAPSLVEAGVAVIDLSADFRLDDPAVYERWYQVKHTATDLLSCRAFGLPELFRSDLKALASRRQAGQGVLVGCAGCYPTATSLAAAPFIESGLAGDGLVVADAVSGVSGAGKKASQRTHFCFSEGNVEAYGVASHRHTPEIEQILGIEGRLVFTPHLAPLDRGLLSTVTIPVGDADLTQEALDGVYRAFYDGSPFVSVLSGGRQPRTSSVAGTNRAHVAAVLNRHANAVVATCAIDNIGKGAAGQAVQCANIVFGLPEQAGLNDVALPA